MALSQPQTVTVDRVSNSGNAIASQQQAGKSVLVPAGEVGETYEVRLVDQGSFFKAELIDSTGQTQPAQPSVNPDTSNLGKGRGSSSHSHEIKSSPAGGKLRGIPDSEDETGQKQRRRMSRRKK